MVGTADVAVGRGVEAVYHMQVHIVHCPLCRPLHRGTVAPHAVHPGFRYYSLADNQVVQIAKVAASLAVGIVPPQGYRAPRAAIARKTAAVLFPHVTVRHHRVHRHEGALVAGVVHHANLQYAAAALLAVHEKG